MEQAKTAIETLHFTNPDIPIDYGSEEDPWHPLNPSSSSFVTPSGDPNPILRISPAHPSLPFSDLERLFKCYRGFLAVLWLEDSSEDTLSDVLIAPDSGNDSPCSATYALFRDALSAQATLDDITTHSNLRATFARVPSHVEPALANAAAENAAENSTENESNDSSVSQGYGYIYQGADLAPSSAAWGDSSSYGQTSSSSYSFSNYSSGKNAYRCRTIYVTSLGTKDKVFL